MNLITTAEHAFAKAAQELVATARFVTSHVIPLLKKAAANEQLVEQVTGLVDPDAVNVERAAFALLGAVVKVLESGEQVAASGGVNIALDAQLVADIRSIIPAVKGAVGSVVPSPKPA